MNFEQRIQTFIDRTEATLDRLLPVADAGLAALPEAMRYAVFNGGKRIRPLLTYAAAEALNIEAAEVDAQAAAVELIHCYSLVHDDLPAMDDDDLRRGQPTVHRKFDEATAILAGDGLLTLAFEALAESGAPAEVMAVLARAAGARGMVGGQALDLSFESRRPDQQALETMFRQKTGALIRSAVEMPAAGRFPADHPVRRALVEYAESIGLAFQIVDDLLDIEGTTEQIGKPAGSDLEHEKATWPALFGIETSREQAESLMEQAEQALSRLPGDTQGLAWLGRRIVHRNS
ncbi:MAG: polyprenyl synthetase family protein [Wenzhouxiangellaceae bacterium]